MDDRSNGYEAYADEFVKRRSPIIGVRTVREWSLLLPPGGTVLDLGCGSGVPISKVLIDAGFRVYGVDASPRMVALFRSNFPGEQVECSPAEESVFFDMRFDGVLAWGLLFLLASEVQQAVIRKAAGVLHPNGRLLFTAPTQACTWTDVLTRLESVSLGRGEYVRAIETAGLTVEAEYDDEGDNHYYSAVLTR